MAALSNIIWGLMQQLYATKNGLDNYGKGLCKSNINKATDNL